MKTINDLWDDLGSMPEEDLIHVMTHMFSVYEKRLNNNPHDNEARSFFRVLETVLDQTSQCNLNRR